MWAARRGQWVFRQFCNLAPGQPPARPSSLEVPIQSAPLSQCTSMYVQVGVAPRTGHLEGKEGSRDGASRTRRGGVVIVGVERQLASRCMSQWIRAPIGRMRRRPQSVLLCMYVLMLMLSPAEASEWGYPAKHSRSLGSGSEKPLSLPRISELHSITMSWSRQDLGPRHLALLRLRPSMYAARRPNRVLSCVKNTRLVQG